MSRTERPRKTKIGTEVGHVTRDLDTTFKVKSKLAGGRGILLRPPHTACFYRVTDSSSVYWLLVVMSVFYDYVHLLVRMLSTVVPFVLKTFL